VPSAPVLFRLEEISEKDTIAGRSAVDRDVASGYALLVTEMALAGGGGGGGGGFRSASILRRVPRAFWGRGLPPQPADLIRQVLIDVMQVMVPVLRLPTNSQRSLWLVAASWLLSTEETQSRR